MNQTVILLEFSIVEVSIGLQPVRL